MEEVKDVVVETEKPNDGKVDMTGADADNRLASPAEETAGQDASGKDVKTTPEGGAPTEGSDDKEIEEAIKSGAPIPYERFKKWNDGKNAVKSNLETLTAENEGMAELLNNPVVFRAILQAKGITDPKILAQQMREAGFEEKEQIPKKELFKQLSEGIDLTTTEGWFEMMERMFNHYSKSAIAPIEQKLNSKETQEWVSSQEAEAKKIAKDVYGLEYGEVGKSENDPNTAIGKMMAYLKKHPEHAGLGHSTIIHLALAPEGVKLGEQKGELKEKNRLKALKSSAFEGDGQAVREGMPNSDWSVSEIMAWRTKHGK